MFEGMLRRQRNGKVYGAFFAIAMGVGVSYFGADLANWRVDSYTWSRDTCSEGSAQRVVIEALIALNDGAPPHTYCREFARDAQECAQDPDAWFEDVMRPIALEGVKCLIDGDKASFKGGGSTAYEVERAHGARSVLLCDGVEQDLEVITATVSDRMDETEHKLVRVDWIAPGPS